MSARTWALRPPKARPTPQRRCQRCQALPSPGTRTHLWGCCRGQRQSPQRRSSVGMQGGRVAVGEASPCPEGNAGKAGKAVSRKPHSQFGRAPARLAGALGVAGPAASASAAWAGRSRARMARMARTARTARATEAVMSATELS